MRLPCLRIKRRRGYTQIELFAVITVVSLILAMVFVVTVRARKQARVSVAANRLKQVATGLELYFGKHRSLPPPQSNLADVLAPFIADPHAFENPFHEESYPGETLSSLYLPPNTQDFDGPGNYLTAFDYGEGEGGIALNSGGQIEFVDVTGVVDAAIQFNPRNNQTFDFLLVGADRNVTREDLLDSKNKLQYDTTKGNGPVSSIRFGPLGKQSMSVLVNNEWRVLLPGHVYAVTFNGASPTVKLWNEQYGKNGAAMGRWHMALEGSATTFGEYTAYGKVGK